ncbi:GTPase IMAP family member 7-like isoform 2-T3 [Acanthopagrus schlegelii]
MRIAVFGKTGAGKSSLANTIFGEDAFRIYHKFKSGTRECQSESRSVSGRSITLVDTPGLFDTDRPEEEMKPEIVSCITECAPGPHAFLIVLKVEKFTEQEQAVINKIQEYFSEEAFKYATVLFTHGDQLPEGETIEDSVRENKPLDDLVKKCGGRCHVIDNKYWKNAPKHEYRSNQFQVEELLKTLDKMVTENNGGCYTNEMLQAVEEMIKQEEENIRQSSGNMTEEEIRKKAKRGVYKGLITLTGIGTGVFMGSFFGVKVMVKKASSALGILASKSGAISALVVPGPVGAVLGGIKGYHAAVEADTILEAARRAVEAIKNPFTKP